jgi:ribosomal protein S18 acetylase RimI-like enzyme
MTTLEAPKSIIPESPALPGLSFRPFQSASDYPKILSVISGCKTVDGLERSDTLERIAHTYEHLNNCDPFQDALFAVVNGKAVGYTRFWWEKEEPGAWLGTNFGFVLPEWRGKGIGSALLGFAEQRARQAAAAQQSAGQLDPQTPRFFSTVAYASEKARTALLERRGYTAVRYEHVMVRPDLENIPEAALPEGLEVRPVKPEHMRAIYDAAVEAFRDHWGYVPPAEGDFENFLTEPDLDPSLWRVAWDGDQVVGMVQSFINANENAEYGRLRGYTEGISVRRPWRRRGVARALLVQSLYAIRERGMQEASLTVDSQNLNQAFKLYESVGFRQVTRFSFYRKAF